MSTALSAFRPRVAMMAPTATDPMIDQCVLDACIDFCDRTLVVKRMLTVFPTVADQAVYTPAVPAGSSVAEYMRVWCGVVELIPLDEEGIATPFGFVTTVTGATNLSGLPRYFNETDPGSLSLYPRPDGVYQINARVALRPTRSATSVDSQLFEDWVEAITSGALARLFSTPGELLNATLAKKHADNFDYFASQAITEGNRGAVRAEQSIRPVHI